MSIASRLALFAVVVFSWSTTPLSLAAATLDRGLGPEPDALDIHLAQSLSALNVLRDLHEGLITLDPSARLIPGLARAWTVSDDGRVWRFELDPRARWSDGEPITADDVVAGWRRALAPATAAPMAGMLDVVANARAVRTGRMAPSELGVRKEGDHGLVVNSNRPRRGLPNC